MKNPLILIYHLVMVVQDHSYYANQKDKYFSYHLLVWKECNPEELKEHR